MKLLEIRFSFDCATVHYLSKTHVHNGKKWKYLAEVHIGGERHTFHTNVNANKSNSLELINQCKP